MQELVYILTLSPQEVILNFQHKTAVGLLGTEGFTPHGISGLVHMGFSLYRSREYRRFCKALVELLASFVEAFKYTIQIQFQNVTHLYQPVYMPSLHLRTLFCFQGCNSLTDKYLVMQQCTQMYIIFLRQRFLLGISNTPVFIYFLIKNKTLFGKKKQFMLFYRNIK